MISFSLDVSWQFLDWRYHIIGTAVTSPKTPFKISPLNSDFMHSVWIWTGGGWHFHHLSCWVMISSSVNYIWRRPDPFQNSEITQPHILSWFQTMSWCLPMRLTTRATTCPTKSLTPRGGKGLWPSSELTLCTFDWKASGMTSTWIWKPPASWWHLDFSSRLWESRARSQCRLSHPRISVFIKAPCDPTKIPQWLFQRAKDWWVQLMPLVMKWWGHGKGTSDNISLVLWVVLPLLQCRLLWFVKAGGKPAKWCSLKCAGCFLSLLGSSVKVLTSVVVIPQWVRQSTAAWKLYVRTYGQVWRLWLLQGYWSWLIGSLNMFVTS